MISRLIRYSAFYVDLFCNLIAIISLAYIKLNWGLSYRLFFLKHFSVKG